MPTTPRILFFILSLLAGCYGFAQNINNNCANASPFCTGQVMNFPATTGVPNSQPGPNYGCLGSQPNPAWFFMQINQGGPVSISMSAAQDIDFICWGPFNTLNGACSNLVQNNIVDCSYSGSPTETCTIANAVPGAFYLFLITNFSNSVQNITFNQSNANSPGAGNTNCGLVCVVSATNAGRVCANTLGTLSVNSLNTSTSVTSFTWSGPNNFTSSSSVAVVPNLTTTSTFTLRGSSSSTINGVPTTATCQALTTISVTPYPVYTPTPSRDTICQGGSLNGTVVFPVGVNGSQYSYTWNPPGTGIASPNGQVTVINPPLLPTSVTMSTIVYTVTVTPNILNCPLTQTMAVTVNNPLTPTLTMPPPVCNTFSPFALSAVPGGGTWSASPAVTGGGIFSPGLAPIGTVTLVYSVNVGICVVSNSGTISVNKFNTAALSSSPAVMCVQDPPFNLMNIVQNTVTGVWTGVNVSNNSVFNPAGLQTGVYNFTYNTVSQAIATVCPDYRVLSISVFNPPTPTIVPVPPRCSNAASFQLSALPAGGVWSGNAGVSVGGVQTPSLNQIGTNFVTYSAGQGTCQAISNSTFHVSEFRPATLTGSVAPLCVTSNPYNLMSIVQNTNGSWSGINISANTFSPAGLATGIYTLTYLNPSFPDPLLCPQSRTLSISVLNPPTPDITDAGPLCSADPSLQLSVSPNTGTWTAVPYLNLDGVFTPSSAVIGNNFVQYVIGTNTCFAQQTKFISVEAFVPADLTATVLPHQCNTNLPFSLSPLAMSAQGKWFGPAVIGSNFDPAVSGAGNFVLSHSTASYPSGLCPDQATVAVTVFSLAPPIVSNGGPYCNNSAPVQLTVSPLGGLFGGDHTEAVSKNGLFMPASALIGSNVVSYSITSGPCIAYTQNTITVQKFISADFALQSQTSYCRNSKAFNLNSLVFNPGGLWSGPGVTGSMFDPARANLGDNNVIVYNTFSSPYPLLCPDTKSITLKVDDVPAIGVVSSVKKACAPAKVVFNIPEINSGEGFWMVGDDSGSHEGLSYTHVYNTPGTYSVVFNYTLGACTVQASLDDAITVLESPLADFEFSRPDLSISDPQTDLLNKSTLLLNNKYRWDIQGLESRYEVNPKVIFPRIGTYLVSLTATNYQGCSHTIKKTIEVKNDFSVYVPNSFSPNADGLNDQFVPVFSPYGLDAETYELEVFDRWGHAVFYSADVRKGWDGTFRNNGAEVMKQDTYVYMLRFRDLDGRIHSKTGVVTLVLPSSR